MIRKATGSDIEGIYDVLKSVGNTDKIASRGFLISNYTKDEKQYREKYARDLQSLRYMYVYCEETRIKGLLFAYTGEEWLQENPKWEAEIFWHPSFDKKRLRKFILVNQTAMYPELTGKGIGSGLYDALLVDITREGIYDIFAETVIAPVPNFASLNFRLKQKYNIAGLRYETVDDRTVTTLVYHKTAWVNQNANVWCSG